MNDRNLEVYSGSGARVSRGAEASGAATVQENSAGDGRRLAAVALAEVGRRANRPDVIRCLEAVLKADDTRFREAARDALKRIRE